MDPPPPPVDLLSSFPEHLQDEILTRLHLRDAVRTSALSRAWRRRWETIPGLGLAFPDGTPPSVVDRVLLRYAGPSVSRFAVHVNGDDDASASHVDDWLIVLSRRSVESITIFNERRGKFSIHSSIFSYQRLVSLSLERCWLPPFPRPGGGFAGLPVLKELYLTYVDLDNGDNQLHLEAMIRASPMLGVLFLEHVNLHDSADRVIDGAPNLHTLGLISYTGWRFGDLPRLQCAFINVPDYLQAEPADFVQFLAGFSQVQALMFNLPICDFKTNSIPFTFSNMKSMELLTDFADMQCISLMCLLRSSPNLEKLKIQVRWSKIVANQEILNTQWTDGMCANLQVVEIISFEGWLPLDFIELILSKASCLCTLSVDACPVSQDDRLNELLNCSRASPRAQVLFKVQLERIHFDRMKFADKRPN